MTTTTADLTGTWQPGAAFVVACPNCSGQLGVAGRLAGQLACCPLCAATFHVPHPERPDAPPPPLNAVAAVPKHPIRHVTASASTVTAWAPPLQPAAPISPAPAWQTTPSIPPTPPTPPVAEAAPDAPPQETFNLPDAVTAAPAQAPVFPAPAAGGAVPAHPQLQFREPVLSVGRRGHEKELRRLSPEERRVRRGRRNIVMLLVGVAVLLVLVLVISMQGRRPDPTNQPPVTDSPQ
jgi:type IV secretory pathway VirB10-like protein